MQHAGAAMNAQPPDTQRRANHGTERGSVGGLLARTARSAWNGNIFSEAAEAAFWQTLSLPPLLLGLLGSLGYVGDWLGAGIVYAAHDRIIAFSRTVFAPNAVQGIIEPTVTGILTTAHNEIASFGFVLSLWAGSSAMASFVDAITEAYGQYGIRNAVWQRVFALELYLIGLVLAIIGLPILALGPRLLPDLLPDSWQPTATALIGGFYYPILGLLLVIALATLYKVALPHRLPWYRGVPGAMLAMVVFILASIGLRVYISWITTTGYTYGALAAPIAFLLMTYFIGLAIVGGAHFNSAIERTWPARYRRWHWWSPTRQGDQGPHRPEHPPAPSDADSAPERRTPGHPARPD